jgi:hypothetical protein
VDELYLATFARFPTARERQTAIQHVRTARDRTEGTQDLLWALINSPAFLFNR